jgi:macrolide transport system ATP-binding/permease protein
MIFRRRRFESVMDDELRFHIEAYADDLVDRGMTRAEALRQARIEFGATESAKDECRRAWGVRWLDDLRGDLRLALRTWRRNPAFISVAVLSLALGIGANTAIFGLMDAVIFRSLPVRDPAGLVFIQTAGIAGRDGPPYPYFELLRDQSHSFQSVAAYSASNMEVVIDGTREQVRGVWVTGNFYTTLGVSPLLGRTIQASDDRPGGAVAVISRAFWSQHFGSDPAIIGRVLETFEQPLTIVGVMPSGIMSPETGRPIDIAVPMIFSDPAKMRDRVSLWVEVVARLAPGVASAQARAEANALFSAYLSDVPLIPDVRKRLYDHIEVRPAAKGSGGLRAQFTQPLTAIMVLAGLVLLAACVNVANLMLARATARRREFAVRLAIGAGRARLICQTLTEALVMGAAGAALAVLFARRVESILASFFDQGNKRIVLDLPLDARMLLFTLAATLLSVMAFGILPALQASGIDPAAGLQAGSRGIAGSRLSLRLGRALVVLQVALSTALLAAAGLFIATLAQLKSVDLGLTRDAVLTMEVTPERQLFGTQRWLVAESEMLDRVRSLPGVRSAAWATMNPMSGRDRGAVLEVAGFVPANYSQTEIHLAAISPDYFQTFGVPLLLGRTFTTRDESTAPKVAILNETAAQLYFSKGNPIGKRVRFANYPDRGLVYEIVGVVKDSKHDNLREGPTRFIYLPLPQSVDRVNRLALAVRCVGNPASLVETIQQELRRVRSTILVTNVSTIEKQVELYLRPERVITLLASAFGVLALALACIGLYGTLAYTVTRRTSELGIRMALGATRGELVWLILREALVMAAKGILIATPALFALGRFSRALLFGISPYDLRAYAGAMATLLVFTIAAAVVPAVRAGRLDAMSALRCD